MPKLRTSAYAEKESGRLLRGLEKALAVARLSIRDVEKHHKLGHGTISRVMRGGNDLRVSHIFLILEAADIEPQRFFEGVYARQGETLEEVLTRPDLTVDTELERKLLLTLARLLGEAAMALPSGAKPGEAEPEDAQRKKDKAPRPTRRKASEP
jgi:hypothetical protein